MTDPAAPVPDHKAWLRLIAAGERLATARSLKAVVDILRATAREIADAEGICVILREGDQCFYAAEDATGPLWEGKRFPLVNCVSGWAMMNRETVVIPDIFLDERVPHAAYRPTFVRSLVMVPIGTPKAVAAVGAYWSDVREPSADVIGRLEALARSAAIALENSRLLESMQRSERQRALAVTAGRMGVWSFDIATQELTTSEACRLNFGRDPAADFSYADLRAAVHPDDQARVDAAIQASIRDGIDYDIEYRLITPAGEERWIGIRAQPTYGADGHAATLAGVSMDITDRRHMERDLQDWAATLEHRVEQRTAELMEAQEALRQSQKLEAMGQLTGGVAHDFNNLLTPIMGSLDMLSRRGVGTEREQKLIAGALESADRAKILVQRLLAFARRQPLNPHPVDITALLIEMSALIGTTIGPRIELVLDLAEDMPLAQADQNQIEMAVLNLAVNARDAMPEGGQLRIASARVPVAEGDPSGLAPGAYVRVTVADTGHGMDEDVRARAIEPFYSTKGIGRGTGLGLSMVHGLLSQLGGAMTLASSPGVGTAVELWLPASHDMLVAEVKAAIDPIEAQARKVLLVDDQALVRATTAHMLADMGFDVLEAGSGAEALALFDQHAIELVVTDQLMPAMTGTELAAILRGRAPTTRILIVSGYSDTAGTTTDLPRLEKPFRAADLAQRIHMLLSDEATA